MRDRALEDRVLNLLAQAIPIKELEAIHGRANFSMPGYYRENGGNVYEECLDNEQMAVATWNNTRPSEKEIIEWFEQALLLA